jgi:hypothetical protein
MKTSLAFALFCFSASTCLAQTTHPKTNFDYAQAEGASFGVIMRQVPNTMQGDVLVGSAVWIGKSHYFATCNHVVKDVGKAQLLIVIIHNDLSTPSNELIASGIVSTIDATVIATDSVADVAILKTDDDPAERVAMPAITITGGVQSEMPSRRVLSHGVELESKIPERGEELLLAGFPNGMKLLITQPGTADGIAMFGPDRRAARILLSLKSSHGHSGGPIFNKHGKVVGLSEGALLEPIHNEKHEEVFCERNKLDMSNQPLLNPDGTTAKERFPCLQQNSDVSFAVPAKFILELAAKYNITFD